MRNTVSEPRKTRAVQFDPNAPDCAIARSNMQVGLWAGAQLNLPEERRAIYALGIMATGMFGPGHNDVFDKIVFDFADEEFGPECEMLAVMQIQSGHGRAAQHQIA
jgi:hypothetical protein